LKEPFAAAFGNKRKFTKALRTEVDAEVSKRQNEVEAQLLARSNLITLGHLPIRLLVEEPLGPERRVKLEVPKPEPCEDPLKVHLDYDCALDKVGKLDKVYKDKNFGFY